MSESKVKKADIPALTIRPPWAQAIFRKKKPKDVENRTWSTAYRGPLAIHSGKRVDEEAMRDLGYRLADVTLGAVIGVVDLVRIVRGYDSEWAEEDMFNWVLKNPRLLRKPIPYKGQQGLFALMISIESGREFLVTK